ncbi:MAG: type transport system permease protein [Acidimicrobiaceae bacterium]|nr:type transport system permease protein [Acidimicrobiaceae bacterium]
MRPRPTDPGRSVVATTLVVGACPTDEPGEVDVRSGVLGMTTLVPRPSDADSPRPVRTPADSVVRVVSAKVGLRTRFSDIWRYRELLAGLTRKELKVKYKNSVLGFLWSMLNPATSILVFYFVFQVVLKNGIPGFAVFLISGILCWNLFQNALPSACVSVVGNAAIVKKVSFPKEILALASVGAALIHMGLQTIVLIFFLGIFRWGPAVAYLPLLVPALLALLVLTAAIGIFLAAMNVRMRDMQHLLEVGLQVWFWATPIVYGFMTIQAKVAVSKSVVYQALWVAYRLNPVTPIVMTFQRAIYARPSPRGANGVRVPILPEHVNQWWYLWQDLLVLAVGIVLLALAMMLFSRLEGNFAEEL